MYHIAEQQKESGKNSEAFLKNILNLFNEAQERLQLFSKLY